MSQKLRLKIGENEIELEGEEKFIETHLQHFLGHVGLGHASPERKSVVTSTAKNLQSSVTVKKATSPAEYYRQKNPDGWIESLIVLAKYLEDHRSLSEFSTKDIAKLCKDVKIKNIAGIYYIRAIKQGLINKIQYGRYQITLTGEDAVSAMPTTKK